MKVGDTVKLKPAMWQGIKPESYGLSFTGEYVVDRIVDGEYKGIKIKGHTFVWDAGTFQIVVKEKEKEVWEAGCRECKYLNFACGKHKEKKEKESKTLIGLFSLSRNQILLNL